MVMIFGCEQNKELEIYAYPEPTVESFTPASGRPGSQLTITGSDFGTYAPAVTIFFNGLAATEEELISVADDEIVVKVPEEATSGKISVKVWTYTKETESDFTVIPGAKVTSLSATSGDAGDQISILGESFGTDPNDVSVFFKGVEGDVEASIVSISETEIIVEVPTGGVTGEVKLIVGPQEITGPIFEYPIASVEYLFGTDGDTEGWGTSHNSTNEVKFDVMKVSFDMAASKRRADFSHAGGMTVHAGVYPIVAIRIIDKPSSGNFIFDTNLGTYKNGSNNWDGVIDDNIYYYDMRNSFGDGNTMSQTEETVLSTFQWKVADITTDETGYFVDWVKTFTNVSELEAYVAEQQLGQNFYGFSGPERTVVPDVYDDWMGRLDQGLGASTTVVDDGYLKVTFPPSDGVSKARADLQWSFGGDWGASGSGIDKEPWEYTPDYPIYAIKVHFIQSDGSFGAARPAIGNIFYDRLGQFNNDYIDQNILWLDASGWGGDAPKSEGSWWGLKVADILSDEIGYAIDWHRTFRSVEEMQFYLE